MIGVDPDAAGGGLGKALLYAGLRHLRSAGDTDVELYVESDHPTAIGLYRGAGFTERSRDVLYEARGAGLRRQDAGDSTGPIPPARRDGRARASFTWSH